MVVSVAAGPPVFHAGVFGSVSDTARPTPASSISSSSAGTATAEKKWADLPLPMAKNCLTQSSVWDESGLDSFGQRAYIPGVGDGCANKEKLLASMRARVADKAGFNNGDLGATEKTKAQRFFDVIRGPGATARYKSAVNRTVHTSCIQVLETMASEKEHLSKDFNERATLALQDPSLIHRFAGPDSPVLLKDMDKTGLTKRNKISLWLSKAGFKVNGLTEFAAAPTGFLLALSKKLFSPSQDPRKMTVGLRALLSLGAITVILSQLGLGLFVKGIGGGLKLFVDVFVVQVVRIVASYSAIGCVTSTVSMILAWFGSKVKEDQELPDSCKTYLHANLFEVLHRVAALLIEVQHDNQLEFMLCKALQNKAHFSGHDLESTASTIGTVKGQNLTYHKPVLLEQLMGVLRQHHNPSANLELENPNALIDDLSKVLGQYLLGSQKIEHPRHIRKEKHEHNKHVQALFGMVEHFSIPKFENTAQDLRQATENFVGQVRDGFLNSLSGKLRGMGFSRLGHFFHRTANHQTSVAMEEAERASRFKSRYAFRNIQENPDQYDCVTRTISNVAYALEEFNNSILLSLNGILARFTCWSVRHGLSRGLHYDAPILPSFYLGRLVSSGLWAMIDALIILPLAAKQGLGFDSSVKNFTGSGPFPLTWEQGGFLLAISVISTPFQMAVILSLILPLRMLAVGSAFIADHMFGYKPNSDIFAKERERLVFASKALDRAANPYVVAARG